MGNRYAVATGVWDTTNTSIWSATDGGAPGASAPTSSDTALLTAASGAITVTLGANITATSVNQTGFTGTTDWAGYKISLTGISTVWTGATTCTNNGTPLVEITYSGAAAVGASAGAVTEANAVSVNFTGAAGVITAIGAFKNLNFSGCTGSLNGGARTVYGGFTPSATMTASSSASATTFAATSGTQTITSNGVTLDFPITVNAPGATVQLADALTLGSTRTFTLTAGALNLNGFNLTTGQFDSGNSNTRSITSNGGQFYCTSTTGYPWGVSTITNLTFVDRATVNITGASTGVDSRVIQCGAVAETVSPDFNITAGAGTVTLTASGNDSTRNVSFIGFSGVCSRIARSTYGSVTASPTMTFSASATVISFLATSGTQVVTTNGVTLDFPITVNAPGATVQLADALTIGSTRSFTLTAGGLDLNGKNLTAGAFSSSNANVRSITSGVGQFYCTVAPSSGTSIPFNVNVTTNLTFVDRPTINLTGNGSGTAIRQIYGVVGQTEALAPDVNVTAGTDTVAAPVTSNMPIRNLNFTGFSGVLSSAVRTLYGNLTLSPTMTATATTSGTTFAATSGTQVITSNGVTMDFPVTVNAPGATVQLADALTMAAGRRLTLTGGTFDANNKNVTCGNYSAGGGAVTRATLMGSGTWTILDAGSAWDTQAAASHTFTPGTATILMTAATAKIFTSGGRTYWNLSNGGAGFISIGNGGSTFNALQNTVSPTGFTLPASTTTTVSALSLAGTAGNLVTLQSSSAGTRATLSKASGTVDVSYLSIKDSAATGGATWQAKPHNGNLDAGNNTGWTFPYDTVAAASMAMTAYAPGVEINVPMPMAGMTLTAFLPSVEIVIPAPLAAMTMTAYAPTFSEEYLGSLGGVVRVRPALSGAITVRPALSGQVSIN